MITLTKSGNAIVFTFDDNDHYLNDGKIEVPVNSLTLVTDESQMATFRKSASNDIFISARYDELGMSKSDLESWFKENACGSTGGGGVTEEEVQDMIDESVSGLSDDISTVSGDVSTLSGDVANKADSTAVTASINAAVSGKMDTSVFNTYSASTDARISEDEEVTSAALNELNTALEDKADTTAVTESINAAVSGKADTSAVTASITAAVSGKQDTLVSGTNIKTINNESLLGSGNIDIQGGGKAIEAGRGIAVTTGATADTVSFDLPISADTKSINFGLAKIKVGSQVTGSSIANRFNFGMGDNINVNGTYTFGFGAQIESTGYCALAAGYGLKSLKLYETSFGAYNNSVSGSSTFGDSGNTLFSVGNGTDNNARHNAFEIRQNGDIYITKDGSDVKLQDQLGGGVPESAFTAYTAATEARLAEDEEVTAAALNELDNKYSTIETTIGDINTILQSI